MESSQSGFQLEQLKLNLFFWGCLDPSSYQHKRRTTFFTSNLPYVISYSIFAKRHELPDKDRLSSASLFILRLLSSGSVVNSPKLGVIQIHTAGETSLPNGASVTVK